MKSKLSVVLAILLVAVVALSACGPAETAEPTEIAPTDEVIVPPTEPPTEEEPMANIIAVCLPALDNPLMLGFQDAFTGAFSGQYDVQVASADGNPNTQATQVENFTAMRVKFMFVMPVESSSLVPKLIAAREAGVIVLVAGGDPGNAEAYDGVMMMNQFLSGMYEAYMAKQWVDETYPDAADGSLETVIFESGLNTEAVNRSNGIKMIAEPYLKNANGEYVDLSGNGVTDANKVANPAYSSKVNVVQVIQAEMFQAGQTAMQNALTTNPNVKLVLAYAGDGGMGASQAILDEFAKGPGISVIEDLDKVAVFGVGMIGAEGPAVLDSATNKTVFRGTTRFGGDLVGRTIEWANRMLGGEIPGIIYDPLDIVTAIDGKLMALAITATEYFEIPTGEPMEVLLGPPPR
ncbi:MAG: sugar ABC transporter substrate-binding protein [Anaerolineales bacterium]|nr:sugar ABC transporter substrate-binding protein [Anaerolineales bacterium]